MSGEEARKVEERGVEPFVTFRHLYNLCMVSMERGSFDCEYKTESKR